MIILVRRVANGSRSYGQLDLEEGEPDEVDSRIDGRRYREGGPSCG